MGSKLRIKWGEKITPALVQRLISSEKDLEKALSIFDSATAEYSHGFQHDQVTFGLMIRRLLSANKFSSAEDMLLKMKQEKCEISEDLFLSIYKAYARVHKPLEVVRMFEQMQHYGCEPTVKSYVTVFSVLVDEGHLKMAFCFYKNLKKMGIPSSVALLNVFIKALCKSAATIESAVQVFHDMQKHGQIPDSYTYATLISGLCRFGRTLEAKELLIEMQANNCSPSVITYTCLIHGLSQMNKLEDAMLMLKEMKSKGVPPNVYTYSSLIDGLCKNGHSTQAKVLLEKMIKEKLVPNSITYSALIHGFCLEGMVQEAIQILDRMKLQDLKPDAGLYSKIVNAFCDISKFDAAADLLDEMVLSGITPHRVTWGLHVRIHNRVVQGLCVEGSLNRSFHLYLSTRSRGISIELTTFEHLIAGCCKAGEMLRSYRILEEMLVDGCIPWEGTWNTLIHALMDRRSVHRATELLQDTLAYELRHITSGSAEASG